MDRTRSLTVPKEGFRVSGDQVFFTVQGEGPSIGKAVVFLRLHLCNLLCGWCDTKYTWDQTQKEYWEESEVWTYQKTLDAISQYPCTRLVITGGEPMLHARQIDEFLDLIPNWEVHIETNGTIRPTDKILSRCHINVSPKTKNSGNTRSLMFRREVLVALNEAPKTAFKFVVVELKDLDEIQELVNDIGIPNEKVVIMPEGVTQEEIAEHARLIVDATRDKGWRLLPRLHIILYGDERKT